MVKVQILSVNVSQVYPQFYIYNHLLHVGSIFYVNSLTDLLLNSVFSL